LDASITPQCAEAEIDESGARRAGAGFFGTTLEQLSEAAPGRDFRHLDRGCAQRIS